MDDRLKELMEEEGKKERKKGRMKDGDRETEEVKEGWKIKEENAKDIREKNILRQENV